MNPTNNASLFQNTTLLHAASLTAELSRQPASFSVRLNFLGASATDPDEAAFFAHHPAGELLFAREVCLCLDEDVLVSARSVCLPSSEYWCEILDCGTRSLGERLFAGSIPSLQRSPFTFTTLAAEHPLVAGFATESCTARRSVFTAGTDILLLTECFLPSLHRYEF